MKQVSSSLKFELAQYRELLSFAQFGSDLDAATKEVIEHGARLTELLKQGQYQPLTLAQEVVTLFSAKHKFIKRIPVENIAEYAKRLVAIFDSKYPHLIQEIETAKAISPELEAQMKEAMEAFTEQFLLMSVK
jgi:F-type H+-transporting ATPase subunit alpha